MSKGIYLIMEKTDNNRYYVGSSIDIHRRMKGYYQKQRADRFIDRSLNKYGFSSFYKHIFYFPDDISKNELRLWEGFYIRLFGSYYFENEMGMNLVKNPQEAPSFDENSRRKISIANKGLKKEWLSEKNKNNKFCQGRTGEKHPMSKKVLYIPENKVFHSFKDCADYICVSRTTIKDRINSNHKDYKLI